MKIDAEPRICQSCSDIFPADANQPIPSPVCNKCQPKYPPSLLRAVSNPTNATYSLHLRTGDVIPFEQAKLVHNGEWVTLRGEKVGPNSPVSHRILHGVDVRVADIVWCSEVPKVS